LDFDDQPFGWHLKLSKRLISFCGENKADKFGRNWCVGGEPIFCSLITSDKLFG